MRNTIEYDAERANEHDEHAFILEINDADEDSMWAAAQWTAMDALGEALGTTYYEDLKPARRRQYNVALKVAQQKETVVAAYRTEQVRWLIAQDAHFEVFGFDWAPYAESPSARILIADRNTAMLFKLTFGGA